MDGFRGENINHAPGLGLQIGDNAVRDVKQFVHEGRLVTIRFGAFILKYDNDSRAGIQE